MINCFGGVITAMITPFKDGKVNFDALGKLIGFQIEGGADALVILGTTGEPSTMTEDEKQETIRYAVKKAGKRIKIIVGAGSNDTAKAVAAAVKAEKLGADGILAVTPYYNKCTQTGIYEYYKAICGAVHLPVIAYNVPSRTGVNIAPETAEKIAEINNLAGIKEASGNMAQVCETMRRIRGKCDLFSGEDALNLPILAIGGAGVISVVSNIAPKLVKQMYDYVTNGNYDKANEVQDKLLPLIDACFIEVNPIPVKEACNILGFDAGNPRPPLTRLEEGHKEKLLKEIKKIYG
ncbi:MAG: 4-hydroxy-tetrahydrodipicolinate synthase [Clostridia bacterium]|nr:4-hydroxy-tetrahydrodipicolinate synthase [Clostridia bacterium]